MVAGLAEEDEAGSPALVLILMRPIWARTRLVALGDGQGRALRHRVQLIFQSPRMSVDPRLRIGDAILEPLAASGMLPAGAGERRALLQTWAMRVGLTGDLLERSPHEVSEGQLQRACLARALVVAPRYLICDELSSMLDVSTQAALLETIAAVQDEQELGVLLITHDRVLADTWCGQIADIRELSAPGKAQDAAAVATVQVRATPRSMLLRNRWRRDARS